MNPKKLRAIILLIAILLLILVIISTLIRNIAKNNTSNHMIENNNNDSQTVYNFNETIDLDQVNQASTGYDVSIGTDYPLFGTISDYYDNADVHYQDSKVYIQSYDGHDVVSYEWMNEGFATYINEPNFGSMEKFVLSPNSISAKYNEVKMKDVISYINELSGLGFNEVLNNKRNNASDYYIYSAQNEEITVTLNYEKGTLVIMVF